MIDRDLYSPLPGRVAGPMYSARLYRGPDHLLKSTVQGFHEHFRRFAWEDIQGLVVEETPWNGVVNVSLVIVLLMLVISYLTFTDKDWRVALLYMPFLALISILMLINLRRGPTCKAWLLTAVSRDRLWSVNRVAIAESLAEAIAPLVRERQEAAARAEAEASAGDQGSDDAPAVARTPRKTGPVEIERGRWHALGLVFIAGFLALDVVNLNLDRSHRILNFVEVSAFALSCMVCITAMVGQIRHRAPRVLQRLGFGLVAYHIAIIMLGLGGVAALLAVLVENRGSVPDMEPRQSSWFLPTMYVGMALQASTLAFGAYTFLRLRLRGNESGTGIEP